MPAAKPNVLERWQALSNSVPLAYPQTAQDTKLLTAIGDLLAGILQELQEQVQEGVVVSAPVTVTQSVGPWQEVHFSRPLFNITVINNGGGNVQYRIPNRSEAGWVTLAAAGQYTFNFIKAKVVSIGLRIAPGGANIPVDIIGSY